jgi:TRAP-type C4-dicarboxylate transport system permease small subunit
MNSLRKTCAVIFGYLLLALSLVVVVETVGRKFLGFSLQGADELGGYVLAVASTLGFTTALIDRGHIRIDVLRSFQPRSMQAVLDWIAAVLMFGFSFLLAWTCIQVVRETIAYGSVAPSPWATPLVYPQSAWLISMILFLLVALWRAIDATLLLLKGRLPELANRHGPKGLEEELVEELENLADRA